MNSKEIKNNYKFVAIGILEGIAFFISKVFLIGLVFVLIINYFGLIKTDGTDKNEWHRSNVELIIDYGTGVHYLYKGNTLIPRIDCKGQIVVDSTLIKAPN